MVDCVPPPSALHVARPCSSAAGWTLETEIAAYAAAPSEDDPNPAQLELKARRAETAGNVLQAYAHFVTLYSRERNPEHLLHAARLKLRPLADPHTASALLGALAGAQPSPPSGVVSAVGM